MSRVWALSGLAVLLTVAASTTFALSADDAFVAKPAMAASNPKALPELQGRFFLTAVEAKRAISAGELDRPVTSMLKVDRLMRHGDFVWNETNVPKGPVWIRVDLDRQLISIFRAGHEIGTAVTLYGANEKATPQGHFRVKWKGKNHHSTTYDAPMPYTLRLTDDGIAIHGSDVRSGRATHGCIGVPTEFARQLFDNMKVGDEVLILG